MNWLVPKDSNSGPIERRLRRPGLLFPLLEFAITRFRSCFGRLLFRSSDGREPRLVVTTLRQFCCLMMLACVLEGMRQSPSTRLEGADPRRLVRRVCKAEWSPVFSFSTSESTISDLEEFVLHLEGSSADTSIQYWSESRFSLD